MQGITKTEPEYFIIQHNYKEYGCSSKITGGDVLTIGLLDDSKFTS